MKLFYGEKIKFITNSEVQEGVICDVYSFEESDEKDLGIITIKAGYSTPRQKILQGNKTIEGIIFGKGTFIIEKKGENTLHEIQSGETFEIELNIGDIMQWKADKGEDMICYEICFPKYEEGRFLNL